MCYILIINEQGEIVKKKRRIAMQDLSKDAIEARREYQRKWRRNNPDKVRRNNASYWERKAVKLKQEKAEANNGK